MTKKLMNTLAATMLVAALAMPALSFAQSQDKDDQAARPKSGARMKAERGEKAERHPVIRRSIQQLENVRRELQNQAAHDFGGHRVEAIKSIDQAIEHLNQALAFDKK
ncbi:MAG TPA: hypothetical protein VFI95_13640 [Terriglobales bacterium]|nr:hypothetical protein [Terriglobales bacterium]